MDNLLVSFALTMALLPLAGSLMAGLSGKWLSHLTTHRIVIGFVAISFILSCYLFNVFVMNAHPEMDHLFYTWATAGVFHFEVAFLLDRLSMTMCVIVLFVSLMVHIYTIAYMAEDPGYKRFFSYMSLFTFAMLMLVLADNFLLLFFGWEGVGLVSYLLIGFWFQREPAAFGSLKAFIVNRISDVGFILGTAAVLMYFGTLNYIDVFQQAPSVVNETMSIFPGHDVNVLTAISLLLFIGAMGKSAQMPMHVWLPESMEGPTPISALIHAATMVTAGIYMVARMSPIFEFSPTVLSMILVIGGTTAFFTGLLAVVQYDIKRVIAYSTLSQLGYMAVALGASAYDAAIFHLITHAFFKALLFLAAGSVIIALHHEQDMRKMGGLAKYMPVTYITFIIGSLALVAMPPFAGFYSKATIIEAVELSTTPGAGYAYWCVMAGVFVTALYTFRALFMTFHTHMRVEESLRGHIHESPMTVLLPLVALAIPSLLMGEVLITPMIYSASKLLGNTIFVLPEHNVLYQLSFHYHGAKRMALEAGMHVEFWIMIAGILTAWLFTARHPKWSDKFIKMFPRFHSILVNKYGFDEFNRKVLVDGTQDLGHVFYDVSDVKLIDGIAVNGSGRLIQYAAQMGRRLQTGYLYQYALVMVLGIVVMLTWYVGGF